MIEHMPIFTKWRAAFGERLIEARGHPIEPSKNEDGLSVLVMACLFPQLKRLGVLTS